MEEANRTISLRVIGNENIGFSIEYKIGEGKWQEHARYYTQSVAVTVMYSLRENIKEQFAKTLKSLSEQSKLTVSLPIIGTKPAPFQIST